MRLHVEKWWYSVKNITDPELQDLLLIQEFQALLLVQVDRDFQVDQQDLARHVQMRDLEDQPLLVDPK